MQSLLTRWSSLFQPLRCPFTLSAPIQPHLRLKPPPLPDLPLEIWLEIFQFATYVHHFSTIQPLDPFTPRQAITNALGLNTPSLSARTKLALVLVSKSWRRIAVQILFRHIVIRSPARANMLLQALEESRLPLITSQCEQHPPRSLGHGEWTRHIEVYTYTRGSANIGFLQTIFKVICLCPNLHFLSGKWIHQLPQPFLDALSRQLGPSLHGISWSEPLTGSQAHYKGIPPAFLGAFQNLTILELRHFVPMDPDANRTNTPRTTLPKVHHLILSSNSRSLQYATALDLPNLQKLTVQTNVGDAVNEDLLKAFLSVHGPSLISVDLTTSSAEAEADLDTAAHRRLLPYLSPDVFLATDICPNLESLAFSATPTTFASHPHPKLRRLGIRGVTADCLYPDKGSTTKTHLMAISEKMYPSLEKIQIVGFLVEAHGDSIMRDVFIWWVERFARMSVMFLDGEGVMWQYSEPDNCQVISDDCEEDHKQVVIDS